MLNNRGEILKKIIDESQSRINIADLAKKIGYDRTTVYQHFKKHDLDYGIILKYGKVLKHDFSIEFPELLEYTSNVEEPLADYTPVTVADALKQIDFWKSKYIQLLEKHNEMIIAQLNKNNG